MLFAFLAIFRKELLIAYRHPAQLLNPLLFFVLVTMLFPLAITSDPSKLLLMGPGVIWISALFANMLTIDSVFLDDFEDGSLELMLLHPQPPTIHIYGKLIAHWLITAMPLLAASLLLAQFFFLPAHTIFILFVSLLLGSPVLTLIGAIGSALTLGLKNRGLLLILMVLPLYLPVLIFGAGATNDANLNLPVASQLCFLGAFFSFSFTFAPITILAALRVSLD